ncbi:MAG: UDP-N-acetylmuramoyl-L-alanine--D-glutamate ligase, partial [Lachnospiraceae bacterium]|nr:UDP-N-acetylmuramoyl-L-alanine--D-glutamate ligase [Candidatus Minthocola equi]
MKKVIVAGAGVSGKNAAKLLLDQGCEVILFDGNENKDAEELYNAIGRERLEIILGKLSPESLAGVTECVISPGIDLDNPDICTIRDAGIPIISEVEAAYRAGKGRIIAITGTNGKTTTTALTGQICSDFGLDTFVVGNIGNAYTSEALKMKDDSISVAEISSFQLETIVDFHPNISAILNITPDHLNRHKTMDNYAAAKRLITKNQTKDDVVVLNYEDERLRKMAEDMVPHVLFFSSARELPEGAFLRGEDIIIRLNGSEQKLCTIHDMTLLGKHNYENVMAAALMGLAAGVSIESIRETVRIFQAVEHRIEYVTDINDVKYYNDSKGTNPDAAIQAINAMVRPTVLIGGGYDKGGEFDEWIKACVGKVTYLVLLGATAKKIGATAEKYGIKNIVYTETFKEAVEKCIELARPGDAVLLSPACASWDMFP